MPTRSEAQIISIRVMIFRIEGLYSRIFRIEGLYSRAYFLYRIKYI
jgi:hypothetical protein